MSFINNKIIAIVTTLLLLFNLNVALTKEFIYKLLTSKNSNYINNDAMARVVMNVLEKCFPFELDMVSIAGDTNNFENWRSHFPSKLVIYRISLSERKALKRHRKLKKVYILTESLVSRLKYPSKLFIVFPPASPMVFKKFLRNVKKSAMWNSRAVYFFVNEEPRSCDDVDNTLKEAWDINIYNAAYVCFDRSRRIQLFSFNPFKNASSEVWTYSHFTTGMNNNISWTMSLFKFAYDPTTIRSPLCPDPSFDKTQDLNNYPVILHAVAMPTLFEPKSSAIGNLTDSASLSDYKGTDSEISQILWSHLRGRPILTVAAVDEIGYVQKNNTPTGLILQVTENQYDMSPNQRYVEDIWHLQTFPHVVHGICIMTLASSRASPPFGVILFDFHIVWRILLLSLAAQLTLVYLLKMSPGQAFLEVLQRLLSIATKFKPPVSCFRRLVYSYVALVFFIGNLQLNSSITSERFRSTGEMLPRNLEEILTAGYTPMGHPRYKEFLDGSLANRFQTLDIHAYVGTLLHNENEKIACFCDCKISRNNVTLPKLLIAGPYFETLVAQLVREDWPLLDTVNFVTQRLVQGGIFLRLDRLAAENYEKVMNERKMTSKIYEELAQPIALEGVTFILFFFAAGQSIAFIIFLTECFYSRFQRCGSSKKLDKLLILQYSKPYVISKHK